MRISGLSSRIQGTRGSGTNAPAAEHKEDMSLHILRIRTLFATRNFLARKSFAFVRFRRWRLGGGVWLLISLRFKPERPKNGSLTVGRIY